jgi:hypothetical protein
MAAIRLGRSRLTNSARWFSGERLYTLLEEKAIMGSTSSSAETTTSPEGLKYTT